MRHFLIQLLSLVCLVGFTACSNSQRDTQPLEISGAGIAVDSPTDQARGLVLAAVSDGSSGSLSKVYSTPPYETEREIAPAGPSARMRLFFGNLYLVNPELSRIDLLDKATLLPVRSFPTGQGTQPMDILVLNRNYALVSDFNGDHLLSLNLVTGEVRDAIDLGGYSDPDGIPEMVMMEKVGNKLYVQLQRFDQQTYMEHGATLAVINLISDSRNSQAFPKASLLAGIALRGTRPRFKMQVDSQTDRLYVATPGVALDFFDNRGVEEIDLAAGQSIGFFITEAQIGGDMGPFAITDRNHGFVAWHTEFPASTHLSYFKRGQTLGQLRMSGAGDIDALTFDPQRRLIFYAEPSNAQFTGGLDGVVFIYDANTATPLSGALSVGKPPVDLLVYR